MKFKSQILAFTFIFLVVGSVGGYEKVVHSDDYAEEIVSVAALKNRDLKLVSVSTLLVGGEPIGSMFVYKDTTTKRNLNYVEFYDDAGNLVAINWFDQFGIERMGIDRGLLQGASELEGVFVVILKGETV